MNLTRQEAIARVGLAAVEAVERKNCDPTNRVGFNGACQSDDFIEWSASHSCEADGLPVVLEVYYFTDSEDEVIAAEDGWDCVTFEPAYYRIV